jgi:alpha-glucosidase (family GH31 glycosyl hydrolase)
MDRDLGELFKLNMQFRYGLLVHYYTQILRQNGTGTLFKPMFFEYPYIKEFRESSFDHTQFMLGSNLILAPSISKEAKKYIMFPRSETWYDLRSYTKISSNNGYTQIECPMNGTVPIFLKGGSLIFLQEITEKNWLNTMDLGNTFVIVVGIDDKESAFGSYLPLKSFAEEEISEKCRQKSCIQDIKLQLRRNSENDIQINIQHLGPGIADITKVTGIRIMGVNNIEKIRSDFLIRQDENVWPGQKTEGLDYLEVRFPRVVLESGTNLNIETSKMG